MTVQPPVDPDLEAMMRRVFRESVVVDERSPDVDFDGALWATLTKLGLTGMMSDQGATWTDAVALLRAAAAHYAPVPLAEHDVLAQWLRCAAGLELSSSPSTACLIRRSESASVPWASQVDRLVVLSCVDDIVRVTDLDVRTLQVNGGRDLAGFVRDRVTLPVALLNGPRIEGRHVEEFRLRGALARCAQMTGAMRAAVELSREYALQRQQFGRPIAQFQAVQRLFVEAAAECELAVVAVDASVAAVEHEGFGAPVVGDTIAVAKSVCGRAASVVSRNAHQIHGAIGTTLEFPLHRLTQPLQAWRSDFGGPREWEANLSARLVTGSDPLWHHVVR